MSFHPNDVQRRARLASAVLFLGFIFLIGSFFRTQIIQHSEYALQSEENRLRMEVGAARQKVDVLDRLRQRQKEYNAQREELTRRIGPTRATAHRQPKSRRSRRRRSRTPPSHRSGRSSPCGSHAPSDRSRSG